MSNTFSVSLSDWLSEDRKPGLSDSLLSALLRDLDLVSRGKSSHSQQATGNQTVAKTVKLLPSLNNDLDLGSWMLLNQCFLNLPLGHDVEQQQPPIHDQSDEKLLSQ